MLVSSKQQDEARRQISSAAFVILEKGILLAFQNSNRIEGAKSYYEDDTNAVQFPRLNAISCRSSVSLKVK